MDNSTNETWIDKLVDELVDAKDEKAELYAEVAEFKEYKRQYDRLIAIVLSCSRLDYSGEELRITNESSIFEYLRALTPDLYNKRLKALKTEQDAELAKLKEAKAEVAATKEEA